MNKHCFLCDLVGLIYHVILDHIIPYHSKLQNTRPNVSDMLMQAGLDLGNKLVSMLDDCMQILSSCNESVVLRQACPQLALACLTASVRQLESLKPDQLASVAFLSAQTNLRLNIKGADQLRALARAGVARASAMSALSLTQFMYGAVASGGVKPAQMQVAALLCCISSMECLPLPCLKQTEVLSAQSNFAPEFAAPCC